ncbi:fimbrillin family protein [Bacteroides sp.]|uniref:fimbrillin family protein n=1 Tax=Bacteroides sp. TaxID=29523 RepID=UPI0026095C0B|nr:fimbrillin family protein [Bacteroides sp.]
MNKILIMMFGVWCLVSCTQQEDDAPRMLEVSAEIAPQTTTRTTESTVSSSDYDKLTFDNTDEILIQKNSETAVTYTKGTNTWKPKDANTFITTTSSSDLFTASYPTGYTGILQDQNTFAGFWKSKKLTSTGELNGNKVTFSFTPAVAKISVVVSYGDVQNSVTASVAGTAIRGGSGSETINLLQTSVSTNKKRYSFAGIIEPGNSRTYIITLVADVDGTKSHNQSTSLTMKAGYNYQYTFTSTNELILTGVTVLPFSEPIEEDSGSAT